MERINGAALVLANIRGETLSAEAELQRDEISRGLRNTDGSIPTAPEPPEAQREKRRSLLSPRTASCGRRLARWLNVTKGTPENRRVCKIIEEIEFLKEAAGEPYWPVLFTTGGRPFYGKMPIGVTNGHAEYERRLSRLERKVRKYPFIRSLKYHVGRHLISAWEPVDSGARGSRRGLSEHEVVNMVLDIALDGEWDRVRLCTCGCGEWFFATHRRRKCQGNHRQKQYRDSPKFKNHRAEWMREYRLRQKEDDGKTLIPGSCRYKHRVAKER